jgi:HSP20 family protein
MKAVGAADEGTEKHAMSDRSRSKSHLMWPTTLHHVGREHWIPAADVYQISSGWIVKLELAGVREEDVAVDVEGNCLLIEGHRRDWLAERTERCESLEITYSRFERRIELSQRLEHCRLETEYRDGMLLVTIVSEESAQ